MSLIKPSLWQVSPPIGADGSVPAEAHPAACPAPRRSPLTARTAALVQRLKAQREPGAPSVAVSSASPMRRDSTDLNRVQLTGTLGSEPLLYQVGDHTVADLALACVHRWRTSAGRWDVETTWMNLSAVDELAEQCGRLLHRGDRVYVEGALRLWTELRGPRHYGCHTIAIDRIVLLAAGRSNGEEA